MLNHAKIKELRIKPERIREFIEQIEEQENFVKFAFLGLRG